MDVMIVRVDKNPFRTWLWKPSGNKKICKSRQGKDK